MTIRSLAALEAFYWVVRLGSFSAAADRLHVSQPTISSRIGEMERRVGRRLLDRAGHRVRPTPHGAAAFEYAGRIIDLVQDLNGTLRSGGPLRGVLRLGTSDGFALVCLSDVLKTLKQTQPELRVAVTVGNSRMLEQRLRDGELDLTILSQYGEAQNLRTQILGEQEVAWVGSPKLDFPLMLVPGNLSGYQIFSNPPPSHLFSVLMDWFEACELGAPVVSSCDSVAVIASLVEAGAGISILPVCIVRDALEAGQLLRLNVPSPPKQRIVAAWTLGREPQGIPEVLRLVREVTEATRFLA